MKKHSYQILDVGIALESDSEHLLDLFATDYAWFETQTMSCRKTLTIVASLHDQHQGASLKINEEVYPLEDHPYPDKYSCQVIVKRLMRELEGFLIFHAGVVTKDGEALIVAGLPGSGKTTLVTDLLKSGFTYFSDDICPIRRETGLVHPFPRSLWQSPPSPSVGTRNQVVATARVRKNKIPLGVTTLDAPSGGPPCKARVLVCLEPGNDSLPSYDLEIGLRAEGEAAVIRAFQELSGVVTSSMNDREWRVSIPKAQRLTGRVTEILTRHARHIWNVYRVDQVAPDFGGTPTISPMPFHEAAFVLIRDLKQGLPVNGNSGTPGISPGALLAEVNQLLAGTSCYRLSPGPRELMGKLAEEVWKADMS